MRERIIKPHLEKLTLYTEPNSVPLLDPTLALSNRCRKHKNISSLDPIKPPINAENQSKLRLNGYVEDVIIIVVGVSLKLLLGSLPSKHGSGARLAPGLLFILLGCSRLIVVVVFGLVDPVSCQ